MTTKRTILMSALLCLLALTAKAQYAEYEIKAAYIFNFAKFIEWPETETTPTDSIYLCIYQKDPFGVILEKTMVGRTANGKSWNIKRINSLKEVTKCHILVIPNTSQHNITQLIKEIGNKPILTIGDEIPNFCCMGGIVNFTPQMSKCQFEMNNEIAIGNRIRINPKLLQLAKIISNKEDEF